MKTLVTGAGGFIGNHLVKYLKNKGNHVIGVDIKFPEWEKTSADEFILNDLRTPELSVFRNVDEVYHLAADMGGIGYINSNKAEIAFNNTMIDLMVLKTCYYTNVRKFLFTSSACIYPLHLQQRPEARKLSEKDAYPADSEDSYGWAKLFTEQNCRHFMNDYGIDVRVARFHNIYGPLGTFDGGREKSPAALCRKIAKARTGESIEIWGDGEQTRSFCYIDDCVEALYRLMQSNHCDPLNIGTDTLVSINDLADIIIKISGKNISKKHNLGAWQGVRGRNADLTKAKEVLQWEPQVPLEYGLMKTYKWIESQVI